MANSLEKAIELCAADMQQCLDLRSLVPHLTKARLLTSHEQSDLGDDSAKSEGVRIQKLLSFLKRKGPTWTQLFTECLTKANEHLGHEHILQKICETKSQLDHQGIQLDTNRRHKSLGGFMACFSLVPPMKITNLLAI